MTFAALSEILPEFVELQPEPDSAAERREWSEGIIAAMSPSAYAVRSRFLRLASLPDDKSKCLIEVVAPDTDSVAVERTISNVLRAQDLESGSERRIDFLTQRHVTPLKSLQVSTVALAFESHDIVIAVRDVPLEGQVGSLVDLHIDLATLDICDLEEALRRRFPDEGYDLTGFVWPAGLSYASLDVACAKARTSADAIDILRMMAGKSERLEPTPIGPLWGYGVAGTWARTLVEELTAYRAGALAWRDLDSGILVVGPPGTGKTVLARRVAAAAGVPLISTSYSDWQAANDGHLGDVLRAIRKSFATAAAASPCVLFIDEVDSIPRRDQKEKDASWFWAVLNCLLEQIDGAAGRAGVIVMAACNFGERVDTALVRPGRLNRIVAISLPDSEALSHILAEKCDQVLPPEKLLPVAMLLAGTTTGADATQIVADARRLARVRGETVTIADIEAVCMPPDPRSAAELWRVAVHECGHVLAALTQGSVPMLASIVRRGSLGGHVVFGDTTFVTTRSAFQEELVRVLAGRAAEEVILGEPSSGAGGNAQSDLALATSKAAAMVGVLGLDSMLVYDTSPARPAVEAVLRTAYATATTIIARHEGALRALATLLVERRTLVKADIEAFASEHAFAALPKPNNKG